MVRARPGGTCVQLPLVDKAIGAVARRCAVPADLSAITTYGPEEDGVDRSELIWNRIVSLYRSGMHPGIQVCIRHRGDVVVDRAIGHARGNVPGRRFDPSSAVAMTVDTPVNLFSAAKAVTAMVMHKLEEQGVLELDDRVADHLPGFERHNKFDITLRHVLGHRAAIATLPPEAFELDLLTDPERIEELLCDLEPTARPGGPPVYHAVTGGLIMEAVARRAAGRSLREVLATEIKEPLRLRWFDLGVAPESVEDVALNVETGLPLGWPLRAYMRRVLGKPWGPVLRMSNDERFLTGVIPSANVIVTARDVAAFYQCLLNGGSSDGIRVFERAPSPRPSNQSTPRSRSTVCSGCPCVTARASCSAPTP